ncbi:N-acetylglucosamine-6-phosphate deacetylase [Halodurantibacterium flavum]|uniref:N-acetylglucosamine-6-phosphate deacetylase n=1 Tax=Halodurantibacterium flavum TaxID=1382802 RepID=A0ABW4S168_9RHOB
MTTPTAYHAPRIFDGTGWHDDCALLVEGGRVAGIVSQDMAEDMAPGGIAIKGMIVPGLVDLQVNGGGGVLFNNDPTPAGIGAICAAHAGFGTTAVMVTMITDTADMTAKGIAAAKAAAGRQPGFLGLHLEGPHLAYARKGTHDPAMIRPMTDADLAMLIAGAAELDRLICTVAPESVGLAQVAALAQAGAIVSLGHTDCSHDTARAYADAGARMVTHLFNAMGQLGHRSPNLTGAALDDGRLWAGLIADGFHVDPAVLRIALRAKSGPAGLFLVSDAMSTVGSTATGLVLNGRQILRADGRLTLDDGTLAGADIALIDAVRYLHVNLGVALDRALHLASGSPAAAIGLTGHGHLRPGARADFLSLTPQITCDGTWIGGERVAGLRP